jgi:uncharacterized protein (TIGR03546 family)
MGVFKWFRKLVGILRGGSTPMEVGMAVVFGTVVGFLPGFSLLSVFLVVLVLLLNAPLGIFLAGLAAGKILALPLAVVTYHIGRALLAIDPVRSAVAVLVNAPVTAWMDLDRYSALGGVVLGLVLGLALSWLLGSAILAFRRKAAALESNSERFSQWRRRRLVRAGLWVFVGRRKAKGMTYAEVLARPTRFLRKAGLVVVGLFLALVVVAEFALAGPLARRALITGLEGVNGATADVGAVDLGLLRGRVAVTNVALCDPDRLDRNRLAMAEIGGSLNLTDLLSRRVVIDELKVSTVAMDQPRQTPGTRFAPPEPLPAPEPPPKGYTALEDYLDQAKVWKERFEKVQRLLDQLKRQSEAKPAEPTAAEQERLGYRGLRAPGLVRKQPQVLIRRLTVEGLTVRLADQPAVYDIQATDLASEPALADADPVVALKSRDGNVAAMLSLSMREPQKPHRLEFEAKQVDLRAAQDALNRQNDVRFGGGTADLRGAGDIAPDQLNLAVRVALSGLKTEGGDKGILGLDPRTTQTALDALRHLDTTLYVVGKPLAPSVRIDEKQVLEGLKTAAVAAGKAEVARLVDGQLKQIGTHLPPVPDALKGLLPGATTPEGAPKPPGDVRGLLDGGLDLLKPRTPAPPRKPPTPATKPQGSRR